MCFNATEAAYEFVEDWERKTAEFQDDQYAIHYTLQDYFSLKSSQAI